MKIAENLTELVGNTPMLHLAKYCEKAGVRNARLIAKLEYFNPLGSVKDRAALAMIEDAEKSGRLKAGSVIIEPTSGNTGNASRQTAGKCRKEHRSAAAGFRRALSVL